MSQNTGVTVFITYTDELGNVILEHSLPDEIEFPHLSFAEEVTEEMIMARVSAEILASPLDYPSVVEIAWMVVDKIKEPTNGL